MHVATGVERIRGAFDRFHQRFTAPLRSVGAEVETNVAENVGCEDNTGDLEEERGFCVKFTGPKMFVEGFVDNGAVASSADCCICDPI